MMEEGGYKSTIGAVVKEVPDFVSWASTQIYPNYLGWNLHAPIRNMGQTWFVTAPELKGTYGYGVVRKAWLSAAKAKAKGENWGQFLDKHNLRSPDFNNEGLINTLSDGLGPLGPLGKGIDKAGKFGLTLYGMSDSANRYLTYHAAQIVAGDLMKGSKEALRFLRSARTGPRLEMQDALRRGDEKALKDTLTNYLIDKTQFNYTRAELSQFAREFGRVYNMFTKWPTMIIGDLEYSIRNRQGMERAMEPFQKYVTPLMLLTGVQNFIETNNEIDPKLQLILGKDISKWSPASAVTGLSAPPLLQIPQATFRALQHASEGELKRAANELAKAGEPFIPGLFFDRIAVKASDLTGGSYEGMRRTLLNKGRE
jgi:hypothetical protein